MGQITAINLDIDKDIDRIHVLVSGGAPVLQGRQASIKISSDDNPSPNDYNDNETEVVFKAKGNDLITTSLLLTSDDVDDNYEGNIDVGEDDKKGDRTHKIQLGGKLVITKLVIKEGAQETEYGVNLSKTVTKKKKVTVKFIILNDGNVDVDDVKETIDRDLKAANERFASVGIEIVKGSVTEKAVPAGLTLPQGKLKIDIIGNDKKLSQDVKTIIEAHGTKDDVTDLHVFYCPFALTGGAFGSNLAGVALNSYFNDAGDAGYLSNIFMTESNWASAFSHELGHILTNDGHLTVLDFPNNPEYQGKVALNLMSQIPTAESEISDSIRFFKTQQTQMQASSHAKNP